MQKTFASFARENPFDLTADQLAQLKHDLAQPDAETASDELVDFTLWRSGLPPRQARFAKYAAQIFPLRSYPHLLEVGCGRRARAAMLLAEKGYQMSAIDPQLSVKTEGIHGMRACFQDHQEIISAYDAIIAQEPCEATEHIICSCAAKHVPFLISLCAGPHRFINGHMPSSTEEWITHMQEIDPEHTVLIYPELIPGYLTPVLIASYINAKDRKASGQTQC